MGIGSSPPYRRSCRLISARPDTASRSLRPWRPTLAPMAPQPPEAHPPLVSHGLDPPTIAGPAIPESRWPGSRHRRSTRVRDSDHPARATIDHPAISLGPGAQSATVNRDHPRARRLSNHRPSRTSLGTGGVKSRPTLFGFCTKENNALCGNCLNLEFGLIQPLHRFEHLF
jgi:hypothetical protein